MWNQPGLLGSGVSNDGDLMRMIQDLQRQLNELRAANPFAPMGMVPGPNSMTFSGSVLIEGNLAVPNGSISNDALQNPIQTGAAANGINNYAITTTSTVRASVTLTVPAGFTQAIVMANPTAMGQNSTSSSDYLYVQAVVQAVNGGELYTAAPAGLGVGLASPYQAILTGLTSGQTITVGVATRAGLNTWAASTANQANIYATAIYLR